MASDEQLIEIWENEAPHGKWPSLADLDKDTIRAMQAKGVETMRRRREAKRLAELQAYTEAHKDLAHALLGGKLTLLSGLMAEMQNEAGEFDTRLLDKDRMKLLTSLIEQMEKRAFGNVATKVEQTGDVNIHHVIKELNKKLARPDDV